jgi:23S rRNA pseudouridine2605 synthase
MPTKRKEDGGKPKEPARKKTAAKAASAKTSAKKTATKKSAPPKSAAKKTSAAAAPAAKTTPATKSKPAAKKTSAAKDQLAAKPSKAAKKRTAEPEKLPAPELAFVDDAVGDVSDGEAHRLLAPEAEGESSAALMEAYRADTTSDAEHGIPAMEPEPAHEERARKRAVTRAAEPRGAAPGNAEGEAKGIPKPEPKLERLQKILSQAGVASRRHAEEMIVAGRVMVNGQVVTQLGAKADPEHDHIRVDGKLLEGAERHRTFLLNKPKGYVTTVSDPEGRPTVVEFFSNFRERLYPVGRLDFQSEGLLLMSNDGELANLLTRAASGVEKTYLVKVSGQPGEDALEQLRSGVMIEREQAGSGRVRTSPASVRLIRPGENPWFEVVLTEGRNRELRKMFHAVGHFVEKIRRVGYGPLVLDVEPGKFRELSAEELNALRLTAEGKLKPRRLKLNAMLPKEAGRSAERDHDRGGRQGRDRQERSGSPRGDRPFRSDNRAGGDRPFRRDNRGGGERGGFAGRGRSADRSGSGERRGFKQRRFEGRPERREFGRGERSGFERPANRLFQRPSSERPPTDGRDRREERREGDRGRERDGFNRSRPERGAAGVAPREERFDGGRNERGERPRQYGGERGQRGEFGGRPRFDRPQGNRPRFDRPRSEGPGRGNRGEEFREDRPRREFRPREEGGERGQRSFRIEPLGGGQQFGREGGQRGGQRSDKGKDEGQRSENRSGNRSGDRPGGQRFGGQRRNHDGRAGHGGGFRKDHRGGGPRRGRS